MASKKTQRRKETQKVAREKMAIQRGEDPASRKKKKKEQRGMTLTTFLGILIIIFVVMRGLAATLPLLQANTTDLKGPVTAKVVRMEKGSFSGDDTKYPVFQYTVDKKSYEHKSLLASGKSKIPTYKVGDSEPVYYDSKKPEEGFSKMEIDHKFNSITGYSGIVILIITLLLLRKFINYLTNRGQQVLKRAKRG